METENSTQRVPLWKQLMGAAVGGSLALGLYYGYEAAQPRVQALLTLPSGDRVFDIGAANIADKTTDEGNRKRILSRTVRNAQMLEQNSDASLDTVDTHEMDVAWPGHNENDPKYTEVTGIVPEEPEPEVVAQVPEEMNNDQEIEQWDMLWEDIKQREFEDEEVEESNADDLPDTGFGLGFALAGAFGGAVGMRKKKTRR